MAERRVAPGIKCSGDLTYDSAYKRWLQKQEAHSRAIFDREPYYVTYNKKVKEMENKQNDN